jgi:hypothetical protein
MSKLIDKLNRVSQAVSSPIGFTAKSAAVPRPKILLIASLDPANADSVADYVAGADAGLLRITKLSSGAGAIKEVLQAASDIPWGGWLGGGGREEITQIVDVGCDFVVFSAGTTAMAILHGEEVGKILEVAVTLGDGLLRAVDKLPVDAVLIGSEPGEAPLLTWQHLMQFQRCADLLTKPLLISAPSDITASELEALWAAGVDGVVIETGDKQPAGKLRELRQMVDRLTLPPQRKRGKPAVMAPYIDGGVSRASEEPEEE